MGLGDIFDGPYEEPDGDDYDKVDKDLVNKLVFGHIDNLRPEERTVEYADIQQTVRWYLAFDIEGWESRRRKFAQKKVAERGDKELQAVQDKVRNVYDDKAGKNTELELFEKDLKAIEEAYESHLEVR